MTEQDQYKLEVLRNILSVFMKHNVVCGVTLHNETVIFDAKQQDVPYKDELVAAGATFDIGLGCWTYWSNKE